MVTCQVLILTPVIVLNMLTSLTVMLETHALVLYLPRPPMLIPWPGPQFTLCMFTSLQPVCMEMQSSPALHKVYSIRVGAILRGRDGQIMNHDSLTAIELQMALRAVDDADTSYSDIGTAIKP
ncbi:hypothetical protein CFC21_004307 [Triticum aestivum]|uniref:Uncharacterized protein n=2 Tax=Triticum TaxID=4564 RepID=A0A9R0QKF9_TRITD|nr:hypothetical protein CFC21_004307 [Triticum aestivum]VAH11239.1 unnamed protein product [Triticum turgidum subsp. durum]